MDLNWLLVQGNQKYIFCIFFCFAIYFDMLSAQICKKTSGNIEHYLYFTQLVYRLMISYLVCFVLQFAQIIKCLTHPFHPNFVGMRASQLQRLSHISLSTSTQLECSPCLQPHTYQLFPASWRGKHQLLFLSIHFP